MEKIKRPIARKSRGFRFFVKSALLTALALALVVIGFILAGYFIIF